MMEMKYITEEEDYAKRQKRVTPDGRTWEDCSIEEWNSLPNHEREILTRHPLKGIFFVRKYHEPK